MENKIKFEVELTPGQLEKLNEWKNAHKLIFGQSGKFTYSFTDNGLTTDLKIKSQLSQHSIYFVI